MIRLSKITKLLDAEIRQIAVGTGQPSAGDNLVGEVFRGDAASQIVGNTIVKTIRLDETQGNGALRSVGLLDSEGKVLVDGAIIENKNASQALYIKMTVGVSEI